MSTRPAQLSSELASLFWDAHCHGHDGVSRTSLLVEQVNTGHVTLMGVRPDDWDMVAKVSQMDKERVIPAYGLHPWFAHRFCPTATATADNEGCDHGIQSSSEGSGSTSKKDEQGGFFN